MGDTPHYDDPEPAVAADDPDAGWDLYDALYAYLTGQTTEVPVPEWGRPEGDRGS